MAWLSWFGGKGEGSDSVASQGDSAGSSGCPVKHSRQGQTTQDSCPVSRGAGAAPMIFLDPRNNMRAGGESQHQGLGQTQPLPKERVVSNIPRADFVPGHQANAGSSNWVYPSEQMFFNAMQRKGWNPSEKDMSSVVAIHNAVNERTWYEVMKWEQMHCAACTNPKLLKFHGRPTDYSPKARMYSLFGYKLPFDRHDWVVDRCGKQVRYVIDFYVGKSDDKHPVSYYLDVRPALDDWQSVVDRVRFNLNTMMPAKDSSSTPKQPTPSTSS